MGPETGSVVGSAGVGAAEGAASPLPVPLLAQDAGRGGGPVVLPPLPLPLPPPAEGAADGDGAGGRRRTAARNFSCARGTVAISAPAEARRAFKHMRKCVPHAVKHLRRARDTLAAALAAESGNAPPPQLATPPATARSGASTARSGTGADDEADALRSIMQTQQQLHILSANDPRVAAELEKHLKTMSHAEMDALLEVLDRLDNTTFADFLRSTYNASAGTRKTKADARPFHALAAAHGAATARESEEARRRRRDALLAAKTHQGHGGARERLLKEAQMREKGKTFERRGSIVERLERKYKTQQARAASTRFGREGDKKTGLWAPWNAARVVDSLLFIDRASRQREAAAAKAAIKQQMAKPANLPIPMPPQNSRPADMPSRAGAEEPVGVEGTLRRQLLRKQLTKMSKDEKRSRWGAATKAANMGRILGKFKGEWAARTQEELANEFAVDPDQDSCEEYDAWTAPLTIYTIACRKHGTPQSNALMRQLSAGGKHVLLKGYPLGPLGAFALAEVLSSSRIADGMDAPPDLQTLGLGAAEQAASKKFDLRRDRKGKGERKEGDAEALDDWMVHVGLVRQKSIAARARDASEGADAEAPESSKQHIQDLHRAMSAKDRSTLVHDAVESTVAHANEGGNEAADVRDDPKPVPPLQRFRQAGYVRGYSVRFNLSALVLVKTSIGPKGCEALVKALMDCDHFPLEELVLEENDIGPLGVDALAQFFTYVTTKGRPRKGHEGMRHHHQRLRRISVANNGLGDTTLSKLLESLYLLNTLEEIDISGNKGQAQSARNVGKLMEVHANHLVAVRARWNMFGPTSAEALLSETSDESVLETLDLSWNGIGDGGAEVVARHAAMLPKLKSLNLSNLNTTDAGRAAVRAALADKPDVELVT